jgi:ubiquinone/menaquinone biosynthesis C-methylase UbiE
MNAPHKLIAEAAAIASMSDARASAADRRSKAETRGAWALGDYHTFAKATVWGLGHALIDACGISAGQRVLDVAAGTGNVAIRAAEAGAEVVASDLTPENFAAGRREASARGIEVAWVEADAEALPFDDGAFDVVTTCLGAMFAPDHGAVATELVRVCRPGGTIGMLNFSPQIDEFLAVFAPYGPSRPPGPTPGRWGSEDHVRRLLGDRVVSLGLKRGWYVERADSPQAYCDLFKRTFGPVVATYAALRDRPERTAALDRDFLQYAKRANRGAPGGPAEYPYEYLLVVARK